MRTCFVTLRIGDWHVRPSLNLIEQPGRSVPLQPQSMDVLVYLAQHAGKVVSSDELLDAVWPNRIVGDDAVHRRVAYLRKQLRDDARNPRYIQTVSKRGYRLVAEVVPISAVGGASVPASRAADPMAVRADAVEIQSLLVAVAFLSDQVSRLLDRLDGDGVQRGSPRPPAAPRHAAAGLMRPG
jgi:DNA-binding winged helix-turn-helix (wHTH) protein